ncbi:MAG: hypothetical protein IH969_10905 [Candidatus Krumholzibacteriota bacterium]|nr:hypothetical protein [Candidatus Krumholzibacteriota bacterium]
MWDRDVTFRVTVFDADGTIIDEVTGRGSPTPGRTVVTGPNLGLVVEVVTRDIDRFATMLRGMNSSQQ